MEGVPFTMLNPIERYELQERGWTPEKLEAEQWWNRNKNKYSSMWGR